MPARQAVDLVVEEEVIPTPQSQNDTTADTIATMLQQAMESLVGNIQVKPRESPLSGGNKGHDQCNEPLRKSIREFLELKPPVFTGASEAEDPLLFLDGIQKSLDTLECSSTRSVELAAYCLQDITEESFKSFKARQLINLRPFNDRFLPMNWTLQEDCPHSSRGSNQASTSMNSAPTTSTSYSARQDVEASNAVVTSILSVCSLDAIVLVDPGSTHFYVSLYFAIRFDRLPKLLKDPFLVATPIGESLLVKRVYHSCQRSVQGKGTLVDLFVLVMVDFDLIMGMDWLPS
ncbi:hypothetical protein RDI58_027053 [Solanum bulbocastanum]|uniref:Gag-pol polyprotein n=1 Tax=Solanum bulbocastanum TaxID=147425 RepID=A0AAN8Y207_SOLBU